MKPRSESTTVPNVIDHAYETKASALSQVKWAVSAVRPRRTTCPWSSVAPLITDRAAQPFPVSRTYVGRYIMARCAYILAQLAFYLPYVLFRIRLCNGGWTSRKRLR